MAEYTYDPAFDAPVPETALGTAGDFAKTFGAGALKDVGGNLSGLLRYGWELGGSQNGADIAHGLQKIFNAGGNAIEDTINPETKKLAAAAMTSPEFWEHPVLATALKATRMAPTIAAMAIPGGLLADVAGASLFAAGAGSALNASDGISQFYEKLDGMSDEELQKESPKYRTMREMLDEKPARARFNREAQSWGPAINAVLGAVSGLVGPAGVAARSLAGGAKNSVLGAGERGVLGSTAVAAGEGIASNAVEEGVSDLTVQNAEMNADLRKEFDKARAANAALEGGVMGGLFGGVVGAVTGGHKPAKPPGLPSSLPKIDDVATTITADPQVKNGSTGHPGKPAEIEANPQNAPTTTERDMGKADPKTKPPKLPTEPPPAPVDPAVAAAVGANEGAPVTAAPTEVAALEPQVQRSPNDTLDKMDAAEKAQAGPTAPEIPAEVTPPTTALLDTGLNVPEAPQSLAEQIKQIGTGERKAAMFQKGTVVPAKALGGRKDLGRYTTPRGTFIYDKALTNVSEIIKLSKLGRENELLGLGPVSKPQAVVDAAAGATPVAITERTPQGVEVKAAAGTTKTLSEQRASLEAQKTPGNVVAVETPEQVIEKRNATGGRILPSLRAEETTPVKALNEKPSAETKAMVDDSARQAAWEAERAKAITEGRPEPAPLEPEPEKTGPGKNMRGAAGKARDEKIAKAEGITTRHVPPKDQGDYARDVVAREEIIARAKAMVADAKKVGLTIQKQLRESEKGNAASDHPSIQILRHAKDLEAVASKHPEGAKRTEATVKFAIAEASIRKGYSDEVLAERREEGDIAMRRGSKAEDVSAAAPDKAAPADQVSMEGGANERITGKDDVTTSTAQSAKMGMRGVSDGTETLKDGTVRAKAASGDKLSGDEGAARKAKMIAEMNASLRPAKIKNDSVDQAVANAVASGEAAVARKPLVSLKPRSDALVVNLNPSEAQIKAKNYKKGHRRVEGLDFTIENPKGAIRRGVDEDGNKWEVRMPADYGYIRGTKGADGDHIDAYDLRSGDRTFVIDQLDTKTGEFDEHKVAFRAKDEQHVVDTYTQAFSDGRAGERLGNIHEVTRPELHDWLDNADTTEPHTMHALVRDMDRVNFDVPEGKAPVPIRGEDALARIDMSAAMKSVGGVLAKFYKAHLQKLAANVDVFHISDKQMAELGYEGANGLHMRNIDTGRSEVYISQQAIDAGMGLEYGAYGHTLLHELSHSVTVREIENSPRMQSDIIKLARAAWQYINDPVIGAQLKLEFGEHPNILQYAFSKNDPLFTAKEFVAEANSNPYLIEVLSRIPVSKELSRYFQLGDKPRTLWDVWRGLVRKAIEKITGKMPQFDSVLDGIMKVNQKLARVHEQDYLYADGARQPHQLAEGEALNITTRAAESVKNWLDSPAGQNAPKALKLRTFDNIARIADHYFGENNPVRKIHSAIERMRVRGEQIAQLSEPLVRNMVALRAANRAAFEEMSALMHDATVANVHPNVPLTHADNAHLGKTAMRGVWAKSQHPELAKRWNALLPEYKQAFLDTTKHFRDQQNAMSLSIIHNRVLKLLGHDDAALALRVHERTLTDADKLLFDPTGKGDIVGILEEAGELSKIEGPYVPLMRRGDHVVKGDYKVTSPGNATVISNTGGDVQFEFKTQKEAEDYVKSSKLQPTLKKIWVDSSTGERSNANELNAVDRYRVTVQNRHVEFVQGKRAARARAAELAADGNIDVHEPVPRSREPDGRQGAELSSSLQRLTTKLERSDAYQSATPTQKAALRQAIEEAALASHGSTRVSSRALPRRGVQGYSEDLVQNTVDYAGSSSRYLARLEHGPALEAGMKEMAAQLAADHSKTNQYARTAISNEVRSRIDGDNGFEQGGTLAPIVKRLLSASFTDKLASPAYSIINAMQPGMVTMPYLSGLYGVGRSFAAMGRAYADINAGSIVKEGAVGTARAARGKEATRDLMTMVKQKLSEDEKRMIDHQIAEGTIDANAGMEVSNIAKSYEGLGGKGDAVLAYMEGVTREMPRAIETINRSVTALATYRLERSKGSTHEKATQAATDAVNSTQFNYSSTNSPAVFNHPLLKLALQFKKYGQGMYQLIGTQIGEAIRNDSPGDRARAVKTLVGIAATHMAMAGALGLPTEPFKYLVMAASPFTGTTWSDVENEIRRAAAGMFGKTGGEVLTRGLPRLFNVDLSRMGLDSVTSFGEPKGNKESDVKSWLFDSVSGPVVSLGGDYIKGLNHIANGEYVKAAEKMIPLKAASDSIRAYRQASEGKKTASGKQSSEPYSPTEVGLRVLGFGTGREAEEGAQRSAYFRASSAQKEERGGLVTKWVGADPNDKAKAWAAVQKYNQTAPAEVKITMKELTDKLRRDAKQAETSKLGINPSKRDKRFLEEGIYNVR